MSKRKHFSPEYKQESVELARRSKSSCWKIALQVGFTPALLTRWVRVVEPRLCLAAERQGMKISPASSASWRV